MVAVYHNTNVYAPLHDLIGPFAKDSLKTPLKVLAFLDITSAFFMFVEIVPKRIIVFL